MKTTRIERIAELNAKIEAMKSTRETLLARGRVNEARSYTAKIAANIQNRDEIELELYEAFGVTV